MSPVFISIWGMRGGLSATGTPDDGKFYYPQGTAVVSDDSIYVADTSNHRIQQFTANSAFISTWGTEGAGDGQFKYAHGVGVTSDGSVYVVDTDNHRIQKFFPKDISGDDLDCLDVFPSLLEAITSALEAKWVSEDEEEAYQSNRAMVADHLAARTEPNQEFTEGSEEERGSLSFTSRHLYLLWQRTWDRFRRDRIARESC